MGLAGNRGLDWRRHLLQGPAVSVLTWLCQAVWHVTHCPLPGSLWGLAPPTTTTKEPAQEEEQPIPGLRVPHRLKTGRPWAGPQGGGRGAPRLGWAGRLGAGSSALPLCCLRGGWGSPRRHCTQRQLSSEVSVCLRQRDSASPTQGPGGRASAGQDRRLSL